MTATVLSTDYKPSNATISGGNLIATATSSADAVGYSEVPATSYDLSDGDLFYFEAQIGSTANDQMIGIGLLAHGSGGYPGSDTLSIGYHQPSGNYYLNGGATSTGIGAGSANDVICVAFNSTKIWWKRNSGDWMGNNASHNPATNTGGVSHGITGNLYAMYRVKINGTVLTFRFATGDWGYSAPSGAREIPATPLHLTTGAWNPSDAASGVTFSSSDYVMENINNNDRGVRAVAPRYSLTTGLYVEYELTGGGTNWCAGIATGATGLTSRPPIRLDNNDGSRTITTNSSSLATGYASQTSVGTVLQLAITASKVWFRFNNTGNWNNTSGHDPSSNSGGVSHSLLLPVYPYGFFYESTIKIRIRALASNWLYGPPTGFADLYGNDSIIINPSLFADTPDTFYAPAVLNTQMVDPSLFVDGDTFYDPTVIIDKFLTQSSTFSDIPDTFPTHSIGILKRRRRVIIAS